MQSGINPATLSFCPRCGCCGCCHCFSCSQYGPCCHRSPWSNCYQCCHSCLCCLCCPGFHFVIVATVVIVVPVDPALSVVPVVTVVPIVPSSETQGQSVGSGEKARRKFSNKGLRAPGYRLSPDHFQKFKRVPAPDWAQKMLCIIVPNGRTVSPEFFSWVRTQRLLSRHTCPVRSPSLCVQGKRLFSTFLTRNEGTTDESKKRLGCYQQEQLNLARIFCFWRITMYL